jgi:hypothetical protein
VSYRSNLSLDRGGQSMTQGQIRHEGHTAHGDMQWVVHSELSWFFAFTFIDSLYPILW